MNNEKQHQLNIRINQQLYAMVKEKCRREFGIGIAPLIKIFLKTFVTQDGLGFFVGDVQLRKLIHSWILKKSTERGYKDKECSHLFGPKLNELYRI